MRLRISFALLLIPGMLFAQWADIAFVNGNIHTIDKNQPRAEAVAVSHGRILGAGSRKSIEPFLSSTTRIIDLKGKLMLPGFIDDHTHFMSGGFQLQSVNLRYADNENDFAGIIRERATKYPKRWITGGDWDHDRWSGGRLPTKELIDTFTPETPVFVNRYDGHMALANSYVLKLAGITRDTPDPPGGSIVKDPGTGEPTGVLKDEAMTRVYNMIPDATDEEMLSAAQLGLAEARKFGLTGIQDISSAADVRIYQKLRDNGELTARFYSRLPISQYEHVIGSGIRVPFGDEWIHLGSLKAFADGSLGSSTALFSEPFTSDTTTHGLASDIILNGSLERWAFAADSAGLQLSIHSIGDSANGLMLDLFERIVKKNPKWDRRFRLEHAQHIHPADFQRFPRLGVIASTQPYHAIDDGRWAEKRIGHERCKTTYAFRTFLDNGVKLCFGSDWTVAPLNPLLGIYAAVTRRTIDGANPGGWFPEQKITVQEAVEAYTINNAYAAFGEHEQGSIVPGKFADFVVLGEDIFSIDPVNIEKVKVAMTVVGGKIVYQENETR
ncbi:MAG TPA: amidohydrolase [Bacteroidota bacterium]|jgi:predicted amidohydrolase YtcJ|nr:amidohydrolase [Bacteroidota bacterium]